MKRFLIALAAAVAAVAGVALPASAATATRTVVPNVTGTPVYNSNLEAGQYVESNGTNYRYVVSTFVVGQALNDIGRLTDPENGGTGVQLCNNSTGRAIQFGIVPDAVNGVFDLEFQHSYLTAQPSPSKASTHDACATGGILPAPVTPGFVSWTQVQVGDTVTVSIYYNRVTGWAKLTASDENQGGTESWYFYEGKWAHFTEPGAGVYDANAASL